MNNSEDDHIGEMLLNGSLWERPIKHYAQVIQVSIHHFYITGEIESEVDRYIDMINIIKTAEVHDKIFLYLNTPGGSINTTIQIVSAINQSNAEVITVIEGEVCSAGTFIFLAGDNYIVNDNCSFMIHNYSHGLYGKGAEVAGYIKFAEKHFAHLVNNFYKDFLTEEEIQDVLNDKDFWMSSDEVLERLKKRGFDPDEMEEVEDALQELIGESVGLIELEEEEETAPEPTPTTKKRTTRKTKNESSPEPSPTTKKPRTRKKTNT